MYEGTTRQFIAASCACLAVFTTGMSIGWPAPVLPKLLSKDSPIPMTSSEGSWMVAIIEVGNYLSPIPGAFAVDNIGRKWTLLATGPITALSYIIAIYSTSVWGLYTMRVLQGMAMSVIYMTIPIYFGEISENKIRGTIGTLTQISCNLGILYTYVLGAQLSYTSYLISSLAVPILFMVTFVFIPESPYYYVSKNQEDKAIASIKWLRKRKDSQGLFNFVEDELNEIKNNIKPRESRDQMHLQQFFGRPNRNALFRSLTLILFKLLIGVQTLIAYATTVFASSTSFLPSEYISILFAVILLVSIFPTTYFVDRSGRRPLFLISAFGCALFSLVAGIYYYVSIELGIQIPYSSWVPFASVSLLGVFFNVGWGSLLTPLFSEYFAPGVKAADMTVCNLTGSTLSLFSYKLFYLMNEHVGVYSNFMFGGLVSAVSTVYIYVYLFETKGKTLSEIQDMFK
ncbi:hypothetical protein WDU94_002823 [Cyamophila willieti]